MGETETSVAIHVDAMSDAVLRAALLSHIERNPGASDTLEGIQRYWLMLPASGEIARSLEEVLLELVETRHMRRTALPDGGVLYTVRHPKP
ncbi:hypothetical protein GCM10007898_34820 [Dyella flagellata]|uniref:Uncharacterized protein n=2 Tax=Dyella flagellata TaxID=1867833 RepID=A0ABQ5XF19_9GAMM|nr:hypothetical protein GCM10007898_34820 [Dyella flagellata]